MESLIRCDRNCGGYTCGEQRAWPPSIFPAARLAERRTERYLQGTSTHLRLMLAFTGGFRKVQPMVTLI
jgi:hypothetical protein